MATEPEQSILDLTARTATADSDLLHINSGGADYKETKADFCKDIVQYVELSNQSSITSQVDTLAGTVKSPSFYAGKINSYGSGPAAVTGAPVANSGHLLISIYSGSYVRIEFTEVDGQYRSYEKFKHGGTWDSQWTQLPSRAEITSLNNSLTNITTGTVTWNSTNVTGDQTRRVWQKIGRLVIVNLEFTPKSGKIVNENEICSGLPAPYNADYAVFGGNQQQVKLWGTGKLQWYFPEDTSTLKRTELLLVYFASTY